MFRFGARAAPQAAFASGARSAVYMGQMYSRRHFARTNSPLLAGFVDPTKLLSPSNNGGGLLALSSPTGVLASSSAALDELVASVTALTATGTAMSPFLQETAALFNMRNGFSICTLKSWVCCILAHNSTVSKVRVSRRAATSKAP
jgi:hypothetical protein